MSSPINSESSSDSPLNKRLNDIRWPQELKRAWSVSGDSITAGFPAAKLKPIPIFWPTARTKWRERMFFIKINDELGDSLVKVKLSFIGG
jgi:hypothetical protein